MTRQRQLVYNIIDASPEHLTADQIFEKARLIMPAIALGTVYRNLGRLVEDGIIRRFHLAGSPDCYDKTVHSHAHTLCVRCGKIADLPEGSWSPPSSIPDGGQLVNYDMTVKCICRDCGKNI